MGLGMVDWHSMDESANNISCNVTHCIDGEKQVGLESRELASGWRGLKKEQERQENLHLDY